VVLESKVKVEEDRVPAVVHVHKCSEVQLSDDGTGQCVDVSQDASPCSCELQQTACGFLQRQNPHPRDCRIKLVEENHIYWLDGATRFPLSVSSVWAMFFPHFDPIATVERCFDKWSQNVNSKYYQHINARLHLGCTKDAIKESIVQGWKDVGDEASRLGTHMHRQIELALNGAPYEKQLMEMVQFKSFMEKVVEFKGWVPYRTEWSVYDAERMIAGQIDAVFYDPVADEYHMVDWKRSRSSLDVFAGQHLHDRRGKSPCDFLIDNKFSHYAAQQNLYAVLLRDFYDIHLSSMMLVQLHECQTDYIMHPVPFFLDIAKHMLDACVTKHTVYANQKWPTDECIHIVVMKYMDNCSAYWETVSEKKMYVVQMATNRRPSPLYQFTKLVEIHGASDAGQMERSPCSMKEVEQRYKAKHQFVGKRTIDVDKIGWASNRIGFYIDEEYVKDFLMWFDDIMAHRSDYADAEFEKIEGPLEIAVHVLSSSPLDLQIDKVEDELKCSFTVIKDEELPVSVFDLPPPVFPPRIVTCNFEMVSDNVTHVIFGGNTKPFQKGFIQAGVEGTSVQVDPSDVHKEYFRVVKDFALEDPTAAADKLMEMFLGCLYGAPVVLRVKPTKYDLKLLKDVMFLLPSNTSHVRIEF